MKNRPTSVDDIRLRRLMAVVAVLAVIFGLRLAVSAFRLQSHLR